MSAEKGGPAVGERRLHYGVEWYGEGGQDGALTACGVRATFFNATTDRGAVTCYGCRQDCACKGGPGRCIECL